MKTRPQYTTGSPQGNKETQSARAPGLPQYQPIFPATATWTLQDFLDANPETTPLTLRRYLERDMRKSNGEPRANSRIVRVKEEPSSASSATSSGPQTPVYRLRAKTAAPVS